MQVRVLTVRYNEGIHRFPEQVIRDVTEGRVVLSMSEHFFMHGNVPHIALVLQLGESPEETSAAAGSESRGRRARTEDVEAALPEEKRGVFRSLREWRNRLAKTMDVAPFKIASNQQFVNIVNASPKTAEELGAVDGISKVFVEKYGEAVLRFVAAANAVPQPEATQQSDADKSQDAEIPF